MVFGAICRFDDAFLLLEFFLDTTSFSHAGRMCHSCDCEHGYPQLQSNQRLIFRLSDERAKATQGPPHSDRRQYENAGSRLQWPEAKCRPNYDGADNESDGIIPGRNLKPPAKDHATEQHQQQKKHADFGSLLPTPTWL